MKMNFREKSEKVTLHSLILSYMQKIRKSIARFSGKTGGDRETERERKTERDGPEFKGPPDAIAKPFNQKWELFNIFLLGSVLRYRGFCKNKDFP